MINKFISKQNKHGRYIMTNVRTKNTIGVCRWINEARAIVPRDNGGVEVIPLEKILVGCYITYKKRITRRKTKDSLGMIVDVRDNRVIVAGFDTNTRMSINQAKSHCPNQILDAYIPEAWEMLKVVDVLVPMLKQNMPSYQITSYWTSTYQMVYCFTTLISRHLCFYPGTKTVTLHYDSCRHKVIYFYKIPLIELK